MGILSNCLFGVAVVSFLTAAVRGQEIALTAKHLCSEAKDGRMRFLIKIHDTNRRAVALKAVDAAGDEINTCVITETSVLSSDGLSTNRTYTVESMVTLATDQESNNCAMRVSVTNGRTYYTWHFRASSSVSGQVVTSRGFVINATCDKNALSDDQITTLAKFNVNQLFVTPRVASDKTGVNTFANNSEVTLTAVIYPAGLGTQAELQDAKGFYIRNCYSGTDPAISQNRQLIVNANGCSVNPSTYRPSANPKKRPNTGSSPLIVDASFIRALKTGDNPNVYIQCQVVKCTQDNDPWCDDPCSAFNSGTQPTSSSLTAVVLSTSFGIQDNPIQQFYPTSIGQNTPLESVTINVNPAIQLKAVFAPNGFGSVANQNQIQSAKGFYLYSCIYADNQNFNNPTTFVNNAGCVVSGTKLSSAGQFQQESSDNFVYVISSGQINLQSSSAYQRLWARCFIGVCSESGHSYCSTRCGATTNNPAGAQNLNSAVDFSFAILNTTTQDTVTVIVTDSDGNSLTGASNSATVGQEVNFGASVFPSGQGQGVNDFSDAKGVYLYSCYTATVEDPTEEQKTYIVNATGCRIPGPYSPSKKCELDDTFVGVEPFNISCGTIRTQEAGSLFMSCKLGKCLTAPNDVCKDRCAAGALTPDSNASDLPSTFSSQTQVVPVNNKRTAVRANEITSIVVGVTVVGPLAALGVVGVITYCIVNAQRNKV